MRKRMHCGALCARNGRKLGTRRVGGSEFSPGASFNDPQQNQNLIDATDERTRRRAFPFPLGVCAQLSKEAPKTQLKDFIDCSGAYVDRGHRIRS